MPNAGCPTHRKGATKAALDLEAPEVDGAIEPRERRPTGPVEAVGIKALAAALAEKSMRALEEDIDFGESRKRQEAARTLAVVCAKLMGDEPDKPPEMSAEERRAKLLEWLKDPDPELAAALAEAGLVKKETTG